MAVNTSTKTSFSHILYWLCALSIFYVGFYLSQIDYMNIEWFSRSGCVVVILGVWASLGVIFKEKLILQTMTWKKNKAFAKSKLKGFKHKHQAIEDEIDEINAEHDKELTEQLQHLKMSIGALEVSLIITGTFIWGFGDILLILFNQYFQ